MYVPQNFSHPLTPFSQQTDAKICKNLTKRKNVEKQKKDILKIKRVAQQAFLGRNIQQPKSLVHST